MRLAMTVLLAMAACGKGLDGQTGPTGQAGQAGHDSLVSITAEPVGSNCAAGGQKIQSGLDTNGNGTLDAAEVKSTSYVCSAVDGRTALVKASSEPPGANCAAGGQKIETGIDRNGNGALESTEVDATHYVCNGETGLGILTKVSAEPAGANCPSAGQRVESGADTNHNGVLDAAEVTQTSFVCNGATGHNSLVKVTAEPAGLNCPGSGQRVDSGIDGNDNGVLDAGEISQTRYVCNGLGGESAVLVSTVNPATVFNNPRDCYFYANNLVSGLWHRPSNRIISGNYNLNGYCSHLAGASGYAAGPNNDTGVKYARMVHMPDTLSVIHAGTNQFASAASTVFIGHIDPAGDLSSFGAAVFSDGFTGNCNLISSAQREFLCYDGTSVRHYATSATSAKLTLVKTVALSQQPTNTCSSNCYGGTFAWDGAFYYFSDNGSSSTNLAYDVYAPDGRRVNQFLATGTGAIDSVYFDWSVGAYATHDGFGGRSGTNNFVYSGGTQGDDSQCYTLSTAHVLP